MKPLWESLARSADSSAQKPALIQEGLTLTYAELLDATAAMVGLLRREGLRPADTVGIQVPHSVDCVVSLLASMRVGATVLLLDASLKQQAVARSCAQAGVGLLLTGPDGEGAPPEDGPRRLAVPPVQGLRGTARRSADLRDLRAGSDAAGSDFLLLSSGTTGSPKLVHRRAGAMEAAARIFATRFHYGPGDRTLAMLPFCHSFGLGNMLLGTLIFGGTMVLAPFSPRQTAATVERERITVLPATPFMFHMLADTAFHTRPDFSSVRLAAAAGSALSPAVAARFKERFGVGISESYGATETGPVALAGPELSAVAGCLGKPYPGVEVQIWDASGERLGPGEPGEIVVKSPAAACEYLGDPEASADRFRRGYVLTGDSGRLDEAGNLFVTGRKKPMVNVAGKKVAPAEVEACLRSHPGVAETLVVAGSGGEGAEWVKALVVPLGDVTATELREHCAARLAAFKVPREVVFVESLASGLMHKPGGAPPEPA